MGLLHHDAQREAFAVASRFRGDFYASLTARGDTLFEITDALPCDNGPVTAPVDLTLLAEHQRGHGAMYDALNCGRIDAGRLRRTLAALDQPRAADGRLVPAVDVSHWLRPDAPTRAERLFCHTYGRGKDRHLMIPGWPYSIVAALESGRTPSRRWAGVLGPVLGCPAASRPWVCTLAALPKRPRGSSPTLGFARAGAPPSRALRRLAIARTQRRSLSHGATQYGP